jgi:hypothetical protein
MYTKYKAYIIYLISFLIVISSSNWAKVKIDDEERLKQLEKEHLELKKEWQELKMKLTKIMIDGFFIEYEYVVKEVDGKKYKEQLLRFVPKDEVYKKAEKMMENDRSAEAKAYIKEYQDRTNYMYNQWQSNYKDLFEKEIELRYEISELKVSLGIKRKKWDGYSSPEGIWSDNIHEHKECTDKRDFCKAYIDNPITFSFRSDGQMQADYSTISLIGKLKGLEFEFTYGGYGKGILTFSPDFKSFEGTFEDINGHKGSWDGERD